MRPNRRALRLGSGLLLFTYVATHLLNHALGLVSIAHAEAGLAAAVRVWHSLPGTVLLYGAAAVHVALAFESLYRRRSLRLPPIEWLRIVMGFGMPLLLIGHVAATRAAFELHGLAPEYGRVIRSLWAAGAEWLQLGLLAPGWIHGCLGLHIAFGHRRWYRRGFLAWFSVALLVPVLSALGFLQMSRTVLDDARVAAPVAAPAPVTASPVQPQIQAMRQTALGVYASLFVLLLLARGLRSGVERQRRALVSVQLPGRVVDMPRGWSVLEGLRSHGIAHASACGGRARCSTCRVRVVSGIDGCAPAAGDESRLLAQLGLPDDVRLACQLRPQHDLSLLPLLPAHSAAGGARSGDGERGAGSDAPRLLLALRLVAGPAARPDAPGADQWFALQQLGSAVRGALRRLPADVVEQAADRLVLAFAPDLAPARAAAALERVLPALAAALGPPESSGELRWVLHHGQALETQASPGAGAAGALLLGRAAAELRGLAGHGPSDAPGLWVSGAALRWLEARAPEAGEDPGSPRALTRFGSVASLMRTLAAAPD